MKILVFNSGSSSQKTCLYEIGETLPDQAPCPLWEGRIEWGGVAAAIVVKNSKGITVREERRLFSRVQVIRDLLGTMRSGEARGIASAAEIDTVGHRVVHGGPHFEGPVVITEKVRAAIDSMTVFAPLHIRAELEGMKVAEDLFGAVTQVAVFDTGFHRQMPLPAVVYPGPYEWFESGIRRYGFHGINHEYCTERAAQILGADVKALKIVSCHLGNGCSVTAIREGRSVDTTMGFTPVEGLMMGTRSGSVDPGILTYIMREGELDAHGIDKVLNQDSGLLGISGVSNDMRDIIAGIQNGHKRAKLAFDIYVHRLRTAIGGMAAVLNGVDTIVFTGGVGENSAEVRTEACRGLEFLGVQLDPHKNACAAPDLDVSVTDSPVRVLVIRAQEDWAIAKGCWKLARTSRPEELKVVRQRSE